MFAVMGRFRGSLMAPATDASRKRAGPARDAEIVIPTVEQTKSYYSRRPPMDADDQSAAARIMADS
jgi:hypothetical protein